MRKKYIWIFIFLIILNFTVFYKNGEKKESYLAVMKEEKRSIHKNEIEIQSPKTKYPTLQNAIDLKLDSIKKEFINNITNVFVQENETYTLFINYKMYTYETYISYVFFIEIDTGAAHPNHTLFTTVYDKNNNEIISLDKLIEKNKKVLEIFSKNSRADLLINPNISPNMLLEGTKPTKENFSNFVFTKKGILLLFQRYQVAPYAYGEFSTTIPYEKITH